MDIIANRFAFIMLFACAAYGVQAQSLRPSTEIPAQQAQPVKPPPPKIQPVKPALSKTGQPKAAAKPGGQKPPAKKPAVKKPAGPAPSKPLQLTPQVTPQTKAAPDATPAPAVLVPAPAPLPERRGLLNRPDPFTPAQRITLEKINQTYNTAKEMSGTFTQVESNGSAASGRFFISKPGRIRFVYDAPSNLDIVADGSQLAIRDKKLGTQDGYPIWQTPLRYLLKEKINLLEDARVVSILQDTNVVTVTIDEDVAMTQGRLTLYFSANDYQLQQWTITDGRGMETSVAVAKLEINKPNDQRLFMIQ